MGIELESWERPLLMVVLDQVSTRGASNTLRLACEDLEAPPPRTAPSSRRVPFLAPVLPIYRPLPRRAAPCLPVLGACLLTQERDLIALALRFAVASHCGEARHKVGA